MALTQNMHGTVLEFLKVSRCFSVMLHFRYSSFRSIKLLNFMRNGILCEHI